MNFSDPRWVAALLALPVLALLEWRAIRRADRALVALAGSRPGSVLVSQRRPGQRRASLALRLGAYALLVLGAAGPEWGRELTRRPASGSDMLFVMDVSASMDARDVAPSRLDEARREALSVLEHQIGSRVGVIAFSGDAVGLCPLTQDLAAARLSIEGLRSGSVSEPGTDLGRALKLAAKLMPPGRREEKIVVLWTDGEDLERGAQQAIADLSHAGLRVFCVGVGTQSGDNVPVLDADGRTVDVKRDENGAAVRSRLDENLLRGLARQTHGGYFSASRPGGELPRLLGALGGLARSTRGERLVERPVARFPLCAGAAIVLIAVFGFRPRRRVVTPERAPAPATPRDDARRKRERSPARTGRRSAGAAVAVVLAAVLLAPSTARAQSAWAKGDHAYREGRYGEADTLYGKRFGKAGPAAVAVNRATAQAMGGQRDQAVEGLSRYLGSTGEVGRTARYNLGTVQGEMRNIDEALRTLRDALVRDPKDEDARWNYEILMRRREQQRSKQPDQKPQPQPPQPQPPQPQPQQNSTGNPPPQPPQPNGTPQPKPNGSPGASNMTREQAEQILGALQEMTRAEQQRQQKVRVLRERRGKDW